jgi:RNA polymerase-binding transcription factor DksA
MPEPTPRFDRITRERLRRALLHRGETLAMLLAEVLAGKDKTAILKTFAMAKPGMRPEEVLRAALSQVERRRILLVNGDDRYGRCDACGRELSLAALDEMPWADRCIEHAAS